MKKRTIISSIILIMLLTAVIAGGTYIYSLSLAPQKAQADAVVFTIRKGETLGEIATRLVEQNIIRSSLFLQVYARIKGTEGNFQRGTYSIRRGMNAVEVHDFLVSGNQMLVKITVPEGWTRTKIAGELEENGICLAKDFLAATGKPDLLLKYGIEANTLEGFLFPDTYLFQRDLPAEQVAAHMIAIFFENLKRIAPEYSNMQSKEFYDKVVLASIIEREYRSKEEAELIASVFYNRLEEHMRLESCATVVYVLTEELDKEHPEYLTYQDLRVESEYNTYRSQGLPPSPIANPGRTAIDAAFHPAETEYLYFVLKGEGSEEHYFSRNYTEHNDAKRYYLKGFREGN